MVHSCKPIGGLQFFGGTVSIHGVKGRPWSVSRLQCLSSTFQSRRRLTRLELLVLYRVAGIKFGMWMWIGVPAVFAIIGRKVSGKFRHFDASHLWVQAVAVRRLVSFTKVRGPNGPAVVMPIMLSANDVDPFVQFTVAMVPMLSHWCSSVSFPDGC